MVYSMTAFATRSIPIPAGMVRFEMRSINHRYLELSFKLPDFLRDLEYALRDEVRQFFQRGKIECVFKVDVTEEKPVSLNINFKLMEELIEASQKVTEHLPAATTVSPFDILSWPSVVQVSEKDWSNMYASIQQSFELVLKDLREARAREGLKLEHLIQERLTKMRSCIKRVRERLPEIQKTYRLKFREKIEELSVKVDESRFEQEMVYWAQKLDVSEEIDRLVAHVEEVERVLKIKTPMGRRLDFLMQELNREANTLGAKATDNTVIQDSIELKVLIEEMREQIQNIE